MSLTQNAILGCWIVFVVFWALGALRTKRTVHRQDLAARLSYSIPTFVGVWLWLKLSQEEALMTRHFPAEYPAYRSEVRALIPRLL